MRIEIEFRKVGYLMVRLLPSRMTLCYDSVVGGGGGGGRVLNKSINVPESTFILYYTPTSAYHTIPYRDKEARWEQIPVWQI